MVTIAPVARRSKGVLGPPRRGGLGLTLLGAPYSYPVMSADRGVATHATPPIVS